MNFSKQVKAAEKSAGDCVDAFFLETTIDSENEPYFSPWIHQQQITSRLTKLILFTGTNGLGEESAI